MAEDQEKKEEEKVEFDSTGQAIGYISLDQARVLAMEHARDNRDFHGRGYARRELVWEELSAEESEDYYRIQLADPAPSSSSSTKLAKSAFANV